MSGRVLIVGLAFAFAAGLARAEVKTKTVAYEHDGVKLKGYLAWDDAAKGKRPGVLVVHEWWGLNDHARHSARRLARLGYVAFAPDMYGEGKTTKHPKEAGQMAMAVRKNVKAWRGRAAAGLKVLTDQENVDAKKLAAIGYCFGGSTALQLAYTGADLAAVVTFHGAPVVPDEDEAKAVKAKLLVCHGADDPFIQEANMQKLRSALGAAKVDYEVIYYGGAQHSFTVPGVDKVGVKGLAYDEKADRRSWQAMKNLFREVFEPGKK
jgi:dienelactone hydrolase